MYFKVFRLCFYAFDLVSDLAEEWEYQVTEVQY